jgi:hypothetical protein
MDDEHTRDPPSRASPDPLAVVRAPVDWLARNPGWAFGLIFVVAFALRMGFVRLIPYDVLVPHTRWEIEAIAHAILLRGEFADPYALPTGPTAHVPPLYPVLLSAVYRVFGLTLSAGVAAWMLGAAFYAAMYAILPSMAHRFGVGRQAGIIAGFAGAVWVHWLSQVEALAGLLLALLLAALVRRWTDARVSPSRSVLLGIGWGAVFLLKPALLPVLVGCLVFELWWHHGRAAWRGVGLVTLGALLAIVPWTVRNYRTFDAVFFVRSNFGLELRVGNHAGAHPDIEISDARVPLRHPRTDETEAAKLRVMGEIAYMRQARAEAVSWIRENPGDFARLTLARIAYFWLGPLHDPVMAFWTTLLTTLAVIGGWRLVPRMTGPQRAVTLIPLATFPLVYYVMAYMARYRIPIEWILLLLAGAAVWAGLGGDRTRRDSHGDASSLAQPAPR